MEYESEEMICKEQPRELCDRQEDTKFLCKLRAGAGRCLEMLLDSRLYQELWAFREILPTNRL